MQLINSQTSIGANSFDIKSSPKRFLVSRLFIHIFRFYTAQGGGVVHLFSPRKTVTGRDVVDNVRRLFTER
jgi:hypothetical protein